MRSLVFMTLNIQGCRKGTQRSQVLSFLQEVGYLVAFLQETWTTPADNANWWLDWGERVFFTHLMATSCGVAPLCGAGAEEEGPGTVRPPQCGEDPPPRYS